MDPGQVQCHAIHYSDRLLPHLTAEILSEDIKGKAAAFCTSLNWVAALTIGLTFKSMLNVLGLSGSYLVFAFINLGGVLFAWSLMVETKQRPLDQIKKMLILE